ncbi:hypothetical protein GX441_10425 [bacterium]|nr:hypothetical protein [bacterium]
MLYGEEIQKNKLDEILIDPSKIVENSPERYNAELSDIKKRQELFSALKSPIEPKDVFSYYWNLPSTELVRDATAVRTPLNGNTLINATPAEAAPPVYQPSVEAYAELPNQYSLMLQRLDEIAGYSAGTMLLGSEMLQLLSSGKIAVQGLGGESGKGSVAEIYSSLGDVAGTVGGILDAGISAAAGAAAGGAGGAIAGGAGGGILGSLLSLPFKLAVAGEKINAALGTVPVKAAGFESVEFGLGDIINPFSIFKLQGAVRNLSIEARRKRLMEKENLTYEEAITKEKIEWQKTPQFFKTLNTFFGNPLGYEGLTPEQAIEQTYGQEIENKAAEAQYLLEQLNYQLYKTSADNKSSIPITQADLKDMWLERIKKTGDIKSIDQSLELLGDEVLRHQADKNYVPTKEAMQILEAPFQEIDKAVRISPKPLPGVSQQALNLATGSSLPSAMYERALGRVSGYDTYIKPQGGQTAAGAFLPSAGAYPVGPQVYSPALATQDLGADVFSSEQFTNVLSLAEEYFKVELGQETSVRGADKVRSKDKEEAEKIQYNLLPGAIHIEIKGVDLSLEKAKLQIIKIVEDHFNSHSRKGK